MRGLRYCRQSLEQITKLADGYFQSFANPVLEKLLDRSRWYYPKQGRKEIHRLYLYFGFSKW